MPAPRTDRLRKRRELLEAKLTALREAERNEEERRHAIVGRIVLAHAEHDGRFRDELTTLLDRNLTEGRERRLFGLPIAARARRREESEAAEEEPREPSAVGRVPSGE